jgi:hypothetical protein
MTGERHGICTLVLPLTSAPPPTGSALVYDTLLIWQLSDMFLNDPSKQESHSVLNTCIDCR